MPTHRSYLDFLVISYICFTQQLPIPCIAAGEDFLGIMLVRYAVCVARGARRWQLIFCIFVFGSFRFDLSRLRADFSLQLPRCESVSVVWGRKRVSLIYFFDHLYCVCGISFDLTYHLSRPLSPSLSLSHSHSLSMYHSHSHPAQLAVSQLGRLLHPPFVRRRPFVLGNLCAVPRAAARHARVRDAGQRRSTNQ